MTTLLWNVAWVLLFVLAFRGITAARDMFLLMLVVAFAADWTFWAIISLYNCGLNLCLT